MILISNATLASTGTRGAIRIEDGLITGVGPEASPGPGARTATDVDAGADRRLDATGLLAAPGFIDLQINGAAGRDLTTDPEAVWEVGAALPRYGVTAFLPTLVSPSWETVDRARTALLAGAPAGYVGATPLGWHVEGPFLSPKRAGAHDPASLRAPDAGAVRDWTPDSGIRMVTLAPELPEAVGVVRELVEQGVVVSAGHSAATYAEAVAGFEAGIRSVTHLFNAMAPLDHREPGLAGAALENAGVTIGLIPDGLHVHPALVATVRRAVGTDRLALVTDAIAALCMPPGRHRLAARDVNVADGSARLADGILAGSVLGLDEGLRNLATFARCEVSDALPSITAVPARLLGAESERGRLEPGAVGDVTLLDDRNQVVLTVVAGRIAYDAKEGGRWA